MLEGEKLAQEEEKEREMETRRATLAEAAKNEEESKRELGRVLVDLSHTLERLRVEEEEKKEREDEVKALQAELMIAAEKEKEVEDAEMGGTGPSF